MSYIQLDNPISRDFAMVPDALWSWPGLSFKAKGFFAYLLSFRHGVCPPVSAMEAQTGLGRDARKAVMRELEAAGLAAWVIHRDPAGRVLAKHLQVSTRPLLAAILSGVHTPENPSHGLSGVHTPEKPSDGKSVARRLKIRALSPENPAIKEEKVKEKGAGAASAGPVHCQPRRLPLESGGAAAAPKDEVAAMAAKLSPFQCKLVREGKSVVLDGQAVQSGSAFMLALQAALSVLERGTSKRADLSAAAIAARVGSVVAALEKKGSAHAAE